MTMSHLRLATLAIGVALISAGPAALLSSSAAATAFGIPADTAEARSYLLAAATRDTALGSWLLALLALGAGSRLLAASVFAIALVALGDAATVVAYARSAVTPALVIHLTGLVVLLALGWLLARGSDERASVSPSQPR